MGLIANSNLQAILDKLARYGNLATGDPEFDDALTAGFETAAATCLSGGSGLSAYILALSDEGVEADLLPSARDLNEAHPTPANGFVLGLSGISAFISALNKHVQRYGPANTTGLDNYLTGLNATTPTLRAHGSFRKWFKTLSAGNVFIQADTDIARVNITGGATGTYTHLATIDKTGYAGAKLVAKNVGALTGPGPVVLGVTGKKFDGTTQALTVSISTLTDAFETDLSVTTKIFFDVTAITVTSGGTSGNVVKIVAKTDRDISAA